MFEWRREKERERGEDEEEEKEFLGYPAHGAE